MARADGRTVDQIRPLTCTLGLLNRAHGSARWSQENTIVLAGVYGPKSLSGKKENPEKALVEVIWKSKSGMPGNFEKEAELVLRRTLEYIIISSLHPNTGISVIIQVVNDDGAVIACAVNAACAALVDAGIPLRSLIAAVSCAVNEEEEVFLDPIKQEERKLKAYVSLVFPNRVKSVVPGFPEDVDNESVENGIVSSITRGAMSVEGYLNCLARCRCASKIISEFARSSIEKKAMNISAD